MLRSRRVNASRRRRTPGAPRSRPLAAAAAVGPASAALDASWEAIVAQLRATPSAELAFEPDATNEYAWASRLGLHINRPPERR